MPRLLIGNFDFEHRLAHAGQPPKSVRRVGLELAPLMVAVAEEGDYFLLPAPIEDRFFERLSADGLAAVHPVTEPAEIRRRVSACPWGWTDAVRKECKRHGWSFAAPPQEVVRKVNSRWFSRELEREWGIALPGSAAVRSLEELAAAVARLPADADRWVVKAEFGMSARERVLGKGAILQEHVLAWVQKRLRNDGIVVFEPWVERVEEAGLQYTIPWTGPPMFEGLTPLLADSSGRYRGSRFSRDAAEELRWKPAIETGMRVARLLKQQGYFGPLGVDTMRYRDREGRVRLRSVQDINARHTMGRLALGLRRALRPGERASWLHVRWPADEPHGPDRWLKNAGRALPAESRMIRTSPQTVAGRPVGYGTVIVTARSAASLERIETAVLAVRANCRR